MALHPLPLPKLHTPAPEGLQDVVLQAQCCRSRPIDALQVPELLQELALPEQYLQL